jgi:EAL domain-containing protein (putative c-di-GMP-specific phosphodiesterase class I)
VSLGNGSLIGFEALIRWQHPEKGMISPADFIPLAEIPADCANDKLDFVASLQPAVKMALALGGQSQFVSQR